MADFIGKYSAAGSCSPSSSCCCTVPGSAIEVSEATEEQRISYSSLAQTPGLEPTGKWLFIAGEADGGDGCHGMTALAGAFKLMSDNLAEFEVSELGLTLNLTRTDQGLELRTSASSCPIKMQKSQE